MQKEKNRPKRPVDSFIEYSSLALQMGACIALFTYLGVYLDEKRGPDSQLYTLIFSLLGVAGGLYVALKGLIKKQN